MMPPGNGQAMHSGTRCSYASLQPCFPAADLRKVKPARSVSVPAGRTHWTQQVTKADVKGRRAVKVGGGGCRSYSGRWEGRFGVRIQVCTYVYV